LEAFTLSSFSQWRPYVAITPEVVPKLVVRAKRILFLRQQLTTIPITQLPFATKSLAFGRDDEREEIAEKLPERVDFLSVFTTCGTFLTSLSFNGIDLYLTLHLKTLIRILSLTPNFKALHLFQVEICNPTFKTRLPNLPNLNTFLLEKVRAKYKTTLLVEPYLRQLTTLEIIEYRDVSPPPLMGSQENLQQLKVFEAGRHFLTKSQAAPHTKRLSICNSPFLGTHVNFLEVMDYIDKFANSLVHLHLDVGWHNMTIGERANMIIYPIGVNSVFSWEEEKLKRQSDAFRVRLVDMCFGLPKLVNLFQT